MLLIAYSDAERLLPNLNVVQYTWGLVAPSASLLRSLLLTLNQSQILCRDQEYVSYAGDITAYGSPILYLVLQTVFLYAYLVWHDSGLSIAALYQRNHVSDEEKEADMLDDEVSAEVHRTERSEDGLRVLHLSKRFGKETAVDNVTFGVQHGEVFALLGPNGAGKSTTIGMIRGDLQPSTTRGDVLVESHSIRNNQNAARQYLGVCPQFDAIDQLTVNEHLAFYARACGVDNVKHNVSRVVSAVGLYPFRHRIAGKLSGGNKRKLSLGIAIIGNPSILLLDEPSSGMDAVAKRVMWKVLSSVKGGRSLVITSHSMEEVVALSDRSGIMAKRILAIGTTKALCQKYGDAYYVHLVHQNAPKVTQRDVARIEDWVRHNIPGAVANGVMLHGQFKYVVPKARPTSSRPSTSDEPAANSIAQLLRLLERSKQSLGIEYYSVTQTTLEDVFLNIVGRYRIEEENQRH